MKKFAVGLLFACMLLASCNEHYYRISDRKMYLYLEHSSADSVEIFCSFDGFQCHPAKKINSFTWEVMLPFKLEFSYFYIVDGRPFVPPCKFKEKDDFGSENCILSSDI